MSEGRGEFDLIARYFRPLAGPEGLDLLDDAAVAAPPPDGEHIVVTCDTMVAGVHFLPGDPPDAIGHKILAVNLSDLAAMGARPTHYLLATSFPSVPADDWLAAFVQGLRRLQDEAGVVLIGGDTTRTTGPLTLTLTAFGHVPGGQALRRSGARAGDLVFVSGTIGDAALALHLARDGDTTGLTGNAALFQRLQRPRPRVALGQALVGLASAAMDVSDGLVADLGHIAAASGVGAVVRSDALPLSTEAVALLAEQPALMAQVLTGGDDYELLFTIPPERRAAARAAAQRAQTQIKEIGVVRAEAGVVALDRAGDPVPLSEFGYRHF